MPRSTKRPRGPYKLKESPNGTIYTDGPGDFFTRWDPEQSNTADHVVDCLNEAHSIGLSEAEAIGEQMFEALRAVWTGRKLDKSMALQNVGPIDPGPFADDITEKVNQSIKAWERRKKDRSTTG